MIDERTKQMIEYYLPNPPDPDLGFEEFYYLQSTMKGDQVIKVQVRNVFPGAMHGEMEYGIYQVWGDGLRWVDVGWGNPNRGCYRSQLYDNKEDCRNQSHAWMEKWENLREIQKKEGLL